MRYVCSVVGMLLGGVLVCAFVYVLYPWGFGLADLFGFFALIIGLCVGLGMGLLLGSGLGSHFFPGPDKQMLSDRIDLAELETRWEDHNRDRGPGAENESIRDSR